MILSQAKDFLENLHGDLSKNSIEICPHWDIDHLCYRVATEDRYQEIKNMLLAVAELLVESPVNGRLISTFKLDVPIEFRNWRIDLIELPAPKAGKLTAEGFEHIEVVVDVPLSELQKKYGHLQQDTGGLSKPFNQELEIVLGARNIKFHNISLESVIQLEVQRKIWSAIQASRVLVNYQDLKPMIVGTYPLGLATPESDVDVIVQSPKVGVLQKLAVEDVIVEVYSEPIHPVRQKAYQHFLIEEKLLKYGGTKLRNEVSTLRKQGLKTEPAFGKALGLENDPYEELLRWQKLSIADLRATLKA